MRFPLCVSCSSAHLRSQSSDSHTTLHRPHANTSRTMCCSRLCVARLPVASPHLTASVQRPRRLHTMRLLVSPGTGYISRTPVAFLMRRINIAGDARTCTKHSLVRGSQDVRSSVARPIAGSASTTTPPASSPSVGAPASNSTSRRCESCFD